MKKKIVILSPHGHRLANQLWNFASIYAYCLEKEYVCDNPSFFRYHRFFNIPEHSPMERLLSLLNNAPWKRVRGWSYIFFEKYMKRVKNKFSTQIISDKKEPHTFHLPPSKTKDGDYTKMLSRIDASPLDTFYFEGWLFRNPVGLEKYRKEIQKYFAPKRKIQRKIADVIALLRKKFSTVIGVHIRQGDYREFLSGKHFFNPKEVREILEEYLRFFEKDRTKTVFIICSDESIDTKIFAGLNIFLPKGDATEDLFTLAKTDVVLGPDSTFPAFASYYGNIPFIVFEHEHINWEYYRDKKNYFENKKSTLTFY